MSRPLSPPPGGVPILENTYLYSTASPLPLEGHSRAIRHVPVLSLGLLSLALVVPA